MKPSNSEKKARRSSILKPPKPSHLLQNVESNISSVESSPATTTAKVKRRVSFAEKKHVKEFCDTMEPGTMWDHTYEETESSHMKISQSSNNDENAIPDECANQLQKNLTNIVRKSISRTEVTDHSSAIEKSQVSIVTESSVSITRSVTTENRKVTVDGYFSTVESELNLEDPLVGLHCPKPSGIPYPANHSESFNARRPLSVIEDVLGKSTSKGKPLFPESFDARPADTSVPVVASAFRNSANFDPPSMPDDDCSEVPMDETLIADVPVNLVAPTSLSVSKGPSLLSKSFNVVPNINFSQSNKMSSHLPIRRTARMSEVCAGDDDKENRRDAIDPPQENDGQMIGSKDRGRISIYRDTSMELTEAVPIRMSSNDQPSKLGDGESETTDFQIRTGKTVEKILNLSGSNFGGLDCQKIDLRPDSRPAFITNVLSTERIPKLPTKRATILCDKSADFPAVAQCDRGAKKLRETAPNGTTIFHDQSVDRTEAVRTISRTEKPTSLFHDKCLNLSALVRDSSCYGNLEKPATETATIFHDQSVDMTEAVPSRPNCEKQPPEKTMIFHNQPVDMTEIVRSSLRCENPKLPRDETSIFRNQPMDMTEMVHSRPISEKQPPEKTAIFHNQSMDMTEVVRSRLACENQCKPPPERTTIFHNQSVDMTEVVRSSLLCENQRKPPSEKTTIFHNQLVDRTEVVPSRPISENQPPEKTTIFHNQSVDMTDVVGSSSPCENPRKPPPERTTIFHNQSVDMTEAVPSRPNCVKQPPEKTTIFYNQPVDMTEIVRSSLRCENTKPPREETSIFRNQSMDMTEMVHSRPISENQPPEKTTIFHNQPVDMTEVVRSSSRCENPRKPPPEGTTIFHNQSVDMTEVIRSSLLCENPRKPPSERTTILHNQSVDRTEVVPSRLISENQPPEKTTIFHNQPVDMTEIVRSSLRCENTKPPREETSIFRNQSMDMTEMVHSRPISENQPPEKTTIFHNYSVDMTEVVRSSSHCENPRKLPPERTTIFHNQSVDMTEVVPSHPSWEEQPSKKATISHMTPMDTAEAIPSGSNLQNPINQSLEHKLPPPVSHDASPADFTDVDNIIKNSTDFENWARDVTTAASPKAAQQMAKNTALLFEKAQRLIARANVIEHSADPDARSPAPKRAKSTGTRRSIDVTAAIPFVICKKSLRPRNADTPANSSPPPPEYKPSKMSPRSARQQSHRFTVRPQKCSFYVDNQDHQQLDPAYFQPYDPTETMRPRTGVHKPGAAIFHDNSMDLTGVEKPTTKINQTASENCDEDPVNQLEASSASEGQGNEHFTSQPTENRAAVREKENASSNDIAEDAEDGKTMVYRDDSMELTKAVSFPYQALSEPLNEVNRPLVAEDLYPCSSQGPEMKDNASVSKKEWLEMMKSDPFLTSDKKQENQVELNESVEQTNENGSMEAARNYESDDITGVVRFADEDGKERQMDKLGGAVYFESENMEFTDAVRWTPGPNVGGPEIGDGDENRRTQLPTPELRSPLEKTQQRQSHVSKELFQKSISSEKDKTGVKSATAGSETADLDAEIRKLAVSLALTNPINESGFDEATFLKQQARCMEDYEANSTASQDYRSRVLAARKNSSLAEKSERPGPGRSDSPKGSVGNEKPALSTANRNSSTIDREHYDRSMEELRCRAYSVGNFRAEVMGYDLTSAISMTDATKVRESIFAEEPPSFVFADSLSTDPIVDRAETPNELPTQSPSPEGGGENVQSQNSIDKKIVSVHDHTETTKHLLNDKPEVQETTDDADVTMTLETEACRTANNFDNLNNAEPLKRKHRSQTFVIKRSNHDATIPIPSSPEIDKDTKNDRLSGVTSEAEFTSESPNGPTAKIRRRDTEVTSEEEPLPTVDKEGNAMELIDIGNARRHRLFANSTVIGDDFTRAFGPPDVEDMSIVLDAPLTDELTIRAVEVDAINEISAEMEISLPKSPFAVLKETVESLAKRRETIWHIHRLDEKIVAFNFFNKSIVLAVYLNDNANSSNPIKVIRFLSQLVEEDTDPGLCLAHRLIMEKVDSASLTRSYRTLEQVPQLLEYVTTEVKLGMNFLFDLDYLRDRTIMEIEGNRVTFVVRTRDVRAGIILSITMEVKQFEDISPDDITVNYLLGREKVRESDIKRLITNVKRDHRFLRLYINDVTDYLDLMAIAAASNLS